MITDNWENSLLIVQGIISSYNSNTYKGRFYDFEEQRPISFSLNDQAKSTYSIKNIVQSLSDYAIGLEYEQIKTLHLLVRKNRSRAGHLKSYFVYKVLTDAELKNDDLDL